MTVYIYIIQLDLSFLLLSLCGIISYEGKYKRYRRGAEEIHQQKNESKGSEGIKNPHWMCNYKFHAGNGRQKLCHIDRASGRSNYGKDPLLDNHILNFWLHSIFLVPVFSN